MRTRRRMTPSRTKELPPRLFALARRTSTLGVVLGGVLGMGVVACGGEARSESQVPAVEAGTGGSVTDAQTSPSEGRWQPAAYVAAHANSDEVVTTRAEEEAVPVAPAEEPPVQPAPKAPALIATDQGEGQRIEPVLSEEMSNAPDRLPAEEDIEPESDADVAVDDLAVDDSESRGAGAELGDADVYEDPAESAALLIEAGTELTFTVETDVTTEDHRAGDVFYAYLTDDVVAADGLVLLPRGVRARGRVVESVASEDSEEPPYLDVVLEELMGPDGNSPIDAVVVHADFEGEARDSDGESVVKVLTGAAAGAILGRILGDDDDAVKGGIAGAAAGAAVAYGTRGGHAKLAAGSQITVRLELPLAVF